MQVQWYDICPLDGSKSFCVIHTRDERLEELLASGLTGEEQLALPVGTRLPVLVLRRSVGPEFLGHVLTMIESGAQAGTSTPEEQQALLANPRLKALQVALATYAVSFWGEADPRWVGFLRSLGVRVFTVAPETTSDPLDVN